MSQANNLPAVVAPSRHLPTREEYRTVTELATRLANTDFVPKGLRGRPDAILACILTGRELGIGPMQALRQIQVIDGTPTVAPELMRALVSRAGHTITIREATREKAVLYGKRQDTGEELEIEWTIHDAAAAGLCKIVDGRAQARSQQGRPKPWETYTRAMLVARATSELCRYLFADIISGVSYIPEEIESVNGGYQSVIDPASEGQIEAIEELAKELIEDLEAFTRAEFMATVEKSYGVTNLEDLSFEQAEHLHGRLARKAKELRESAPVDAELVEDDEETEEVA